MNKSLYRKNKKKRRSTRKKRLHKRSYKGGDIAFNLKQILGIIHTPTIENRVPQPFIQ